MPSSRLGQLISFSIDNDPDRDSSRWIFVNVRDGDTVQKIASRRGHPELARRIADANGIRSVNSKLGRPRIKVPGELREADGFDVLAGDDPPRIVEGYARFGVLDRPERTGLTVFEGYSPIVMEIPIRFEDFISGEGADIERDIALLERMAGRGNFAGASSGPPPIVRVSTTNGKGERVPLIPSNYQWSKENKNAPTWRVAGLDWDPKPLRNRNGNRVRQLATVKLQQHTRINLLDKAKK